MRIRAATAEDAAAIASIYAHYVEASAITFELEPPSAETIAERIVSGGDRYPWLAAVDDGGTLLGYAYATAFRNRAAYDWSVETTVYVAAEAHRKGLGTDLYRPLLAMLEAQGFTQAFAAIALPNAASVRLHESFGFDHVGTYAKSGYKLGAWWDVGLWQRALAPATLPPPALRPLADVLGEYL